MSRTLTKKRANKSSVLSSGQKEMKRIQGPKTYSIISENDSPQTYSFGSL